MELEMIEDYVIKALEINKLTRQDDFILYGQVLKFMGIDTTISFNILFKEHNKFNLPAMESVTRARRKVQELRPELADKNTIIFRQEKINEYVDYSLDK